jgi:bifunctional non-homologous end joining protein LigD
MVRMKAKPGDSKTTGSFSRKRTSTPKPATVFPDSPPASARAHNGGDRAKRDEKFTRNPFDNADAQLATLVKKAPEGEDWLYELKYDGYRILAWIERNSARLQTRNGNDYTGRFHDIASA